MRSWASPTRQKRHLFFYTNRPKNGTSLQGGEGMEITLKAARINAGLTQEQVKAKTGYSRNSLYRWEKGIGSPKWKDLKRLCELYGVPAECIKK